MRFFIGKYKKKWVTDKETKDFTCLCIHLNDCDMNDVIIGRKAEQEILSYTPDFLGRPSRLPPNYILFAKIHHLYANTKSRIKR